DDDRDNRQPPEMEGVTAEQGEYHHYGEDGEDGERDYRHAGGPGPSAADGGGSGGAGHRGLAPRQVGEQGGQVGGGTGLKSAAGAVLEFLGRQAAGLVVLAQLGDGPVAV